MKVKNITGLELSFMPVRGISSPVWAKTQTKCKLLLIIYTLPLHMHMIIREANKFGNLNESELSDFETSNSVSFPIDYRKFLLKYNGGRPEPNIVPQVGTDINWIYGMHQEPSWASLYYAVYVFNSRVPNWYLPIGCDSSGNQFIMSLYPENRGTMAFWKHESELKEGDAGQYFDNVSFIANSFTEFINSLISTPNLRGT